MSLLSPAPAADADAHLPLAQEFRPARPAADATGRASVVYTIRIFGPTAARLKLAPGAAAATEAV